MKKKLILISVIFFSVLGVDTVLAQTKDVYSNLRYKKSERTSGVHFGANSERDELLTDESKEYEEITTGVAAYRFSNCYINYTDYTQREFYFNFEAGPLAGTGNFIDSSYIENRVADHNILGVRTSAALHFSNRFYYNLKSYTLVKIRGNIRYDWFKQHSTGTAADSNGVITPVDEKINGTKFRYGFEAKAGWGSGRLNPMNNYMLAQHILEKYYAGRNFSDTEIKKVAEAIYLVKAERSIGKERNEETEIKEIGNMLNSELFLKIPVSFLTEWEMSEMLPRFSGQRVEGGPFFRYYNREPDFVYGGFVKYENEKYCNLKWNRSFSADVSYNGYKRDDWVVAEIKLGWSFLPSLKREFDFGVKYIPGVVLKNNGGTDFNQGVIPYVGYFSQINSKARVNFSFAYRISGDEKIMIPGPEFSLAFYSSRY